MQSAFVPHSLATFILCKEASSSSSSSSSQYLFKIHETQYYYYWVSLCITFQHPQKGFLKPSILQYVFFILVKNWFRSPPSLSEMVFLNASFISLQVMNIINENEDTFLSSLLRGRRVINRTLQQIDHSKVFPGEAFGFLLFVMAEEDHRMRLRNGQWCVSVELPSIRIRYHLKSKCAHNVLNVYVQQ